MADEHNPFLFPGKLEIYCGPMKCGKTRAMLERVDKLPYANVPFVFFKPTTDTRDMLVHSRFGDINYDCLFVNGQKPEEIIKKIDGMKFIKGVVLIDEAQFFPNSIVDVIDFLTFNRYNVIAGGLDLDFRGEPFGQMPFLLSKADEVVKLYGVCEHVSLKGKKCSSRATRTQRLIDGLPAEYGAPIVSIEGKNSREIYQCRCLEHHIVPGKKQHINI